MNIDCELHPIILRPEQVREMVDLDHKVTAHGVFRLPIPEKLYRPDWVVAQTGDIAWLLNRSPIQAGRKYYVRERHMLNEADEYDGVTVEYSDGTKKEKVIRLNTAYMTGKWIGPVAMPTLASRLVFLADAVVPQWNRDGDTASWAVYYTKIENPDELLRRHHDERVSQMRACAH